MSAIVGVYFLDARPVDRSGLDRMMACLAHRGPDGLGMWVEGAVGLGHRMLRTTPESLRENLPLANKAGNLVITADARVDNRDELIAMLGQQGRPRAEVSDSELILSAYERWGERCPEKLLGDFSFAIWDARRQLLFCARDPAGVKPFYYHYRSGRGFVFASELKALLCLPDVPRRLNELRVAQYLVPNLEDKAITFYQDVLRLPPAQSMTVTRQGARTRAYWSLNLSTELRLRSDDEYAEAFRELFTEAVRSRLRSSLPVGSLLSGGLDSSSIVCVARELLAREGSRRLHTFSTTFDDVPECDERSFISAVLSQNGLESHLVRGDLRGPLADLDRVLSHEDEPFYAPNLFLHWGLYTAAQQQSVRVLLDGFGGDAVVSHGMPYLTELARAGRWMTLTREINRFARNSQCSPGGIFRSYAIRPIVPELFRQVWRALRRCMRSEGHTSVMSPDFARRIGLTGRSNVTQGKQSRPPRTSRQGHYGDLTSGLIPFSLEVADKAAAAYSIEPRYPFFDRRLMEFCLALPPEQKFSQGWTRVVMRRALGNILPEAIRWRGDKADLSHSFDRGLLAFDRERLEEVILRDSNAIEGYADLTALRETYRRYACQGGSDDAFAVWRAVTLALWLGRADLTN